MERDAWGTGRFALDEEELESAEVGELAADEFYFDGPYMVFTAVHHLKRGYCCNSDCRHCPYKD